MTQSHSIESQPSGHRKRESLVSLSIAGALGGAAVVFAYNQTAHYNELIAINKGCSGSIEYQVTAGQDVAAVSAEVRQLLEERTGITPLDEQVTRFIHKANSPTIKPTDTRIPAGVGFITIPEKCADPSTTLADFTGTKQRS